jgi:hypothetical protein
MLVTIIQIAKTTLCPLFTMFDSCTQSHLSTSNMAAVGVGSDQRLVSGLCERTLFMMGPSAANTALSVLSIGANSLQRL